MTKTILILIAMPLAAHDLWIEPTTFFPEAGQVVGAKLRVGQDLLGDPVGRSSALIREMVAVDAKGRRALVGREGADPAGLARIDNAGLTIIGYYSNPSIAELPADKFNAYLKEEGLNVPPASKSPVKDSFLRCAKALLQTGAGGADRVLGFPLELVAEKNPYALTGELPVQLIYQGKPLAGALVVAFNKRNPDVKQSARSDAQGRVKFRVPDNGMWLVKAVHIVPAGSDWTSYWASLTFERKVGK
jgi:uncharacterized GH25 family protein